MHFDYEATATASRFHLSKAPIRLLMGPVGCGKTVALCAEIMSLICTQPKSKRDGKRKSKILVIRNTYPELKTTTIETWLQCFPTEYWGKMRWDIPITHEINIGDIEAEIIFMSVNSQADLGKLMSLNITHAAINEARFIPWGIIEALKTRIGRYPENEDGVVEPRIIMDTNPPTQLHWIYKKFEVEKPKGFEIFKCPPAVIKNRAGDYDINPWADNLDKIPGGPHYYLRQIPGASAEWIKVFLEGQYGTIVSGKPVYPEYNDQYHFVKKTLVINGTPIGLGWDFGLMPAVLIGQLSPTGRFIIHEEITGYEIGITKFVTDIVIPTLNRNYPQWRNNYISIGDPAGAQRAQTDEKTCFQILGKAGIITRPALTNSFVRRREAVAYFLTRFADGKPAFAISEKAPITRNGFLGAYHYKEIRIGDEQAYREEPEKNASSHPHDALQYLALHFYGDFLMSQTHQESLTRFIV